MALALSAAVCAASVVNRGYYPRYPVYSPVAVRDVDMWASEDVKGADVPQVAK